MRGEGGDDESRRGAARECRGEEQEDEPARSLKMQQPWWRVDDRQEGEGQRVNGGQGAASRLQAPVAGVPKRTAERVSKAPRICTKKHLGTVTAQWGSRATLMSAGQQ